MRMEGVVFKTAFLLTLSLLSAAWVWQDFAAKQDLLLLRSYASVGGVISFVCAMATLFSPGWARFTAPVYAVCKGASLAGISLLVELWYPGVALQALPLTFAVLAGMLLVYRLGLVRVTPGLYAFVLSSMMGILLFYLLTWLLQLFGIGMPYLHQGSLLGIGFSLFVVGLASLNLLFDFDFIERAQRAGAPRHMEWYGAFALLLTLVWIYLELLQLLVRMRDRNER